MHKIWNVEKVKNFLEGTGYSLLEDTFSTLKNGFICVTKEGYKVKMTGSYIYNGKKPRVFDVSNPYTIENINHYIELNEIKAKLLDDEYCGNTKKMMWECQCGNKFLRSWNAFLNGEHICKKCAEKKRGRKKRRNFDDVYAVIKKRGYSVMDINEDVAVTMQKIGIVDADGYKYSIHFKDFEKGKEPFKFEKSNPYTIENINLYLQLDGRGDYICTSSYSGNNAPLEIKHLSCQKIFTTTLVELQGRKYRDGVYLNQKRCPFCFSKRSESLHATVLKQVFQHEYPDTVLEDNLCRNPDTNRVMATDIVNHERKIVVEVQGQFHDGMEQKYRDNIKKEFWESNGYTYYAPDIRDYTILGMVQIFFPYITEIPSYVNYGASICTDPLQIQKELDAGKTIKEIALDMGIKKGTINAMYLTKKLYCQTNTIIKLRT